MHNYTAPALGLATEAETAQDSACAAADGLEHTAPIVRPVAECMTAVLVAECIVAAAVVVGEAGQVAPIAQNVVEDVEFDAAVAPGSDWGIVVRKIGVPVVHSVRILAVEAVAVAAASSAHPDTLAHKN